MILSDVCEFIVDCPHSTAPDEGKGYPLIRTPNVGKGRLDLNGVHRVSESVYKQRIQRGAPRANDLIFAREAPAGNVALVQENQTVCLGQRTVLIRPNVQKVNPQYLVYYLLSPKPQYELLGTANGATVAHVNLPAIRNLKIELPEKSVQDKIGTILVTYDDLIENNQKQIKLLEEAAQRLYKEWFVDLNFPGHENTKIVDGVPEGWRISSIYDVFDIKYGKNLPTSKITKTGQYPVYGASGVIGYYNEKNCDDYATLVTSRGNGSGDVFRTHHKQSYITNNSFIARRNDKNSFIENEFTFQLFSNTDFKKLCTGSAQPQLTNTSIQKIKILLPNRQLIEKYQRCTIEMSEKQEALYQEQRALTQARNRLLPKLMNGTVEV